MAEIDDLRRLYLEAIGQATPDLLVTHLIDQLRGAAAGGLPSLYIDLRTLPEDLRAVARGLRDRRITVIEWCELGEGPDGRFFRGPVRGLSLKGWAPPREED